MNYSEATAVINCPTKTGSLDIPHEKRNTYIWSAKVEMTLFLWYCFKIFAFFFVLFFCFVSPELQSSQSLWGERRKYFTVLPSHFSDLCIGYKLKIDTSNKKNLSRLMAYHVRFTIFRANITNSLNEEKLTKHKSDFASIFLTQPIRNDVMDFDKFEKIFHHRNKLEPQKHNECLPLTSGKRWSDSPDFALVTLHSRQSGCLSLAVF